MSVADIAPDGWHIFVPGDLMARMYPGTIRDRKRGGWMIPMTVDAVRFLNYEHIDMSDRLSDYAVKLQNARIWAANMKTQPEPAPWKEPPIRAPYKLYQHQVRAYNIALAQRSCALLMDMGTGKSLTTVMVAGRRYLDGQVKRLLVVAPASVCSVWEDEFPKFGNFACRVGVMLGTRQHRERVLKGLTAPALGATQPLQVLVINYESAWRFADELRDFAPDMVVLDESQRIKTPSAKQSKFLHGIGDMARYKLILTGTPIQKDTRDLWSQYRFLDPTVFAMNYTIFQRRYAVMGGFENRQYLGPRNLDELTRKAHAIAYQVKKEECLDLPEKTFETLPVVMGANASRIYEALVKDSIAALSLVEDSETVTAAHVLTRMIRLQQLTGGFVVDDDGKKHLVDSAKLDAAENIIQNLCVEEGKKLVIFARFLAEMDEIQKRIESMGIGLVRIDGSVPSKDRGELVKAFQTDERVQVFLGELDACAEGLTLTAAQTVLYYSVNWNFAKYDQSVARIHRIGQTGTCNYIHLIVRGTIDETIMAALGRKENLANSFATGWRTIIH